MPVEYAKEPAASYPPPFEGVKATISVRWYFRTTIGTTVITWSTTELELNQAAFTKQPDRGVIIYPTHHSGSITLTASSQDLTITPDGKLTFETAPDDNALIEMWAVITVTLLDSLRTMSLAAPTRVQSYPMVVTVSVTKSAVTTACSMRLLHAGAPVTVQRNTFREQDAVIAKGDFMTGTYDALWVGDGTIKDFYLMDIAPWIVHLDFKNSAENPMTAFIIGALSAGVKQAGIELLKGAFAGNEQVKQIADLVGVTIGDIITTYVAVLGYMVEQGWKSWSDFSMEEMVMSLSQGQMLATAGLAGSQAILTSLLGQSRGTTIANLLISGGKNTILASAYLTFMSKLDAHVYPS